MVSVDTQLSLLTYLYELLTKDEDLKTFMGGEVRLYLTWAETDAAFPYLVHRIDIAPAEPYMMRQATYYLDIWSDKANALEALAIRAKIIQLLDELQFSTEEAVGCRLWLQTDGFIPEDEEGIWHYALQFNLRYYRQGETEEIIGR